MTNDSGDCSDRYWDRDDNDGGNFTNIDKDNIADCYYCHNDIHIDNKIDNNND